MSHCLPSPPLKPARSTFKSRQARNSLNSLPARHLLSAHPALAGQQCPKPKGGTRPLGIATVEDRVVQTAMKLVLEPIFEADFHDCSYGYRPRRDAKMASKAIRNDLYRGAWSVVELDFRSYFTTIPHDKLMILIKQRVVDGSMLRLIKQSLTRSE